MSLSNGAGRGDGRPTGRSLTGLSWHRDNLLRKLAAAWPRHWHKRKLGVSTGTLDRVLRNLYERCQRGQVADCEAFDDEIGAAIDKSTSQVNQATLLLKRIGFLEKTPRKARRRTLRSHFAIEWASIDDFVNGRAPFPLDSDPIGERTAVRQASRVATEWTFRATEPDFASPLLNPDPTTFEDPPPSFGDAKSISETWKEVEGDLSSCRVAASRQAIDDVRLRGVAPSDVRRLIEHYRSRPGAWGPGALFTRLRNHTPGRPIEEGWAPVDAKFEAARRRETELQQAAASRASRDAAAGRREADGLERQRLESAHGSTLDAMDRTALLTLAGGASNPFVREMVAAGKSASVRNELLRAIDGNDPARTTDG